MEGKGWQRSQLSPCSAASVRFAAHHSCLPSHARLDKRIYLANSKKCSLRRHVPGRQAGERKRCFCLFGQRVLGEEIGFRKGIAALSLLVFCLSPDSPHDAGIPGRAGRGTKARGQKAAPERSAEPSAGCGRRAGSSGSRAKVDGK